MKIVTLSKERFDAYSAAHPCTSFQQTSGWGKLKSLVGWRELYLGYEDEQGQLQAAGLFLGRRMPLFNKYLYYCPHGYLIDLENKELLASFQKDLSAALIREKGFELIIDPYFPYQQRDIDGKVVEGGYNHQSVVDQLCALGFVHSGFNTHFENLQPRFLFRLDMQGKTYSELQKDFRYEARRRIGKKDFLAITVREMSEEEIPEYKRLMALTAERRGFIDRPLSYYKEMYECLHPQGILHYYAAEIDLQKAEANVLNDIDAIQKRIAKLAQKNPESVKTQNRIHEEEIVLHKDEELLERIRNVKSDNGKAVLSDVCLLTYGQEAIMLLAGNDEEYLQDFNTSNIIVGELIRISLEQGYRYYNFYGISGDFDPNNEHYGLYSYKKQYGGEVVELIGQFELTLDPFIKVIYEMGLKVYKFLKKVRH
ncbi:MAG: peptidoglycan bridge formation glycyltransferase FemA/FemB family protein [Erysipelotrichaceae bacterium]|nr:peptidoglycan bridge formation glycyltransferase FemA/FemB family protein [Erysipelotrichaceae bacterium]